MSELPPPMSTPPVIVNGERAVPPYELDRDSLELTVWRRDGKISTSLEFMFKGRFKGYKKTSNYVSVLCDSAMWQGTVRITLAGDMAVKTTTSKHRATNEDDDSNTQLNDDSTVNSDVTTEFEDVSTLNH